MPVDTVTNWDSLAEKRQDAIRRFLIAFLRNVGGRVRVSPEIVEAWLDKNTAKRLRVAEHLLLCFRPGQKDSAEYISFGSPLLDACLKDVVKRGSTCSLLFAAGLKPEFVDAVCKGDPFNQEKKKLSRSYSRLVSTVGRIRFPNAVQKTLQRRIVHQLQLLFTFRVSFVSDEKQEQIVPVIMDPLTEKPASIVNLGDAVAFNLPLRNHENQTVKRSRQHRSTTEEALPTEDFFDEATKSLPKDAYSVIRLYRLACQRVVGLVKDAWDEFVLQGDKRLNRELRRIDDYYQGLAQEALDPLRQAFRKIASLSVRTQLTHSYQNQKRFSTQLRELKAETDDLEKACANDLSQLEAEKERRRKELMAKYEPKTELLLTNVAALHVPRVEYKLSLQGAAESRELTFVYDILRDSLLDLNCEACEKPLEEVWLCGCGDLVCQSCIAKCPGCGRELCPNCATAACHMCDSLVCEDCLTTCPLNSETEAPVVCSDCGRTFCSECQGFAPIPAC